MPFEPVLPLTIKRLPGGYRITDASDRHLITIYCREPPSVARAAHVLTFDEGKDLAQRVARLLSAE